MTNVCYMQEHFHLYRLQELQHHFHTCSTSRHHNFRRFYNPAIIHMRGFDRKHIFFRWQHHMFLQYTSTTGIHRAEEDRAPWIFTPPLSKCLRRATQTKTTTSHLPRAGGLLLRLLRFCLPPPALSLGPLPLWPLLVEGAQSGSGPRPPPPWF